MLRNYQDENSHILNIIYSIYRNPRDAEQHLTEIIKRKPGSGPPRDPKGLYVLIFAIVLTIFCCIAGIFIGEKLAGGMGAIFGAIVGFPVGLIFGRRLFEYLDKLRVKKWQRSVKKQDEHKETKQGPFVS